MIGGMAGNFANVDFGQAIGMKLFSYAGSIPAAPTSNISKGLHQEPEPPEDSGTCSSTEYYQVPLTKRSKGEQSGENSKSRGAMPPLTDVFIRSLKGTGRTQRHWDGQGLYLEVTAKGTRVWRLKYRYGGKEKRLTFGSYPEITLAEAREMRGDAKKLLVRGTDPTMAKKAAESTFEAVAREWLNKMKGVWVEAHHGRTVSFFQNDLFPYLGSKPVADITAPEILAVVRRVERRALERAHRALGACGQVMRYAIATGRAVRDPAADLRGALPPCKESHLAAPTEPKTLAPLLRVMYGYEGTPPVRAALRLAPLVFVRPGELRKARWADVDLEAGEWRYISSKTKQPHIVPLSRQAVAILKELQPVTGRSEFVFPSARSSKRPMSDNAVLGALRRSDIAKDQLTGHGLRATARTILDEVLGFRPDIIEHQLAHVVKDPNGRAYNRTSFLPERREMMQKWADYLDKLRCGEVVQMPKRA